MLVSEQADFLRQWLSFEVIKPGTKPVSEAVNRARMQTVGVVCSQARPHTSSSSKCPRQSLSDLLWNPQALQVLCDGPGGPAGIYLGCRAGLCLGRKMGQDQCDLDDLHWVILWNPFWICGQRTLGCDGGGCLPRGFQLSSFQHHTLPVDGFHTQWSWNPQSEETDLSSAQPHDLGRRHFCSKPQCSSAIKWEQ